MAITAGDILSVDGSAIVRQVGEFSAVYFQSVDRSAILREVSGYINL